jgi:uncharacterized membrane protein YtjA (UPF0391 family)
LYRYRLQILLVFPGAAACIALHFNNIAKWLLSCTVEQRDRLRRSLQAAGMIRRTKMLYYALVFLLIAILAAVFGFGGVAIVSAGIAKILFFVFIVLFLVSLITHMSRRV